MPKKAKHKEAQERIALDLTWEERAVLPELFTLDEELEKQITQTKAMVPLSLTLDEWEFAAEGIAAEVNHTTSRKRRRVLEGLLDKIDALLQDYFPEEPNHNEEKVIDLTTYGLPGPGMEAEAMEYLHHFVDDLLETCSTADIDVEQLLASFTPTRVEPQDRIGVRLNGKQRAFLLDLPELPKTARTAIQSTPPRKQKVELTLREVHELENTVARLIHDTSDSKRKRALQRIDGELIDVQVRYTDGNDDSPSALKLAACPDSLSRGALVRQMLTQILQSRLQGKKGRDKR